MGRNLLFINKYPEIIDEFLKELKDKEIEIDTADNGIDAAILLKKKEYQIVITGLLLEGFNGEQIVTYVNKVYPDTVCIIYTTTISAAQLHFFVNKRDVYRVFLRPVNFRQEFFQALEEAYEYHGMKKKNREDEQERVKHLRGNKEAIADMEGLLEQQKEGWGTFEKFSAEVLSYTITHYGTDADVAAQKNRLKDELTILDEGCKEPSTQKIGALTERVMNL